MLAVAIGDYGKPRPAVVVQSDELMDFGFSSVVVCPMTSAITGGSRVRVAVEPDVTNGLSMRSEVMVEKLAGIPRTRIRRVIGRLDQVMMAKIDRALFVVLGLGRARP